jgi:hypothetical protein
LLVLEYGWADPLPLSPALPEEAAEPAGTLVTVVDLDPIPTPAGRVDPDVT